MTFDPGYLINGFLAFLALFFTSLVVPVYLKPERISGNPLTGAFNLSAHE